MAGKLVHFEIPAQDDGRATKFYGDLFAWEWNTADMPGLAYHMTQAGDVGGAVYKGESAGGGPIVYFDAEDIDATVARVRELGGDAEDKQPIPGIGWFARCHDTEGNGFSLFQSDESVPHG
jgi:predicted enzyme related to lactoylglutathione lyase